MKIIQLKARNYTTERMMFEIPKAIRDNFIAGKTYNFKLLDEE